MSSSSSTLHVRDVPRDKLVTALVSALVNEDWERFDARIDSNELEVRRFRVVQEKSWFSVAGPDGELLDDLGARLSKKLASPVLTIFTWDGEAVVLARHFDAGREQSSFELPRDAERDDRGRARVRSATLEPWLDVRTRKKLGGWLVLDGGRDEYEEERDDDFVFVSEAESLAAIGGLLGIEEVALGAYDEDGDEREDGVMLAFRPSAAAKAKGAARAEELRPKFKGRMPVLPPREGAYGEAHRDAYALADYAARGYAVGWIAFDAPTKALTDAVLAALKPLVGALLPARTADWKKHVAALKKARVLDLCAGPVPERKTTNIWSALPGRAKKGEPPSRVQVPGVVGWSVPLPKTDAARRELAACMHDAMTRALANDGCIGACVVGAGRGRGRPWAALPYEVIAGIDAGGLRLAWAREHVRSPGWRVVVPSSVAARLPKKKPPNVSLTRGPAGVLVAVDTPDAFAQLHQDAEPIERYLLDLVGTPRELRDFLG